VVIHDFHVEGIAFVPVEADPPLIIDPYTVLSGTFPVKTKCPRPPEIKPRRLASSQFHDSKTLKEM